ncbi:hypothetical protein OIU77_019766 [Salix suchowensis]|uniref:Uncharacterized protein n=1 Tax=Salix suchowensis TaxID=1278906 RepID=A0ABQ9CLF8_9ROSI|nr:hypothetical protein OIU77_019766 [Salix suchowensis]
MFLGGVGRLHRNANKMSGSALLYLQAIMFGTIMIHSCQLGWVSKQQFLFV